VVLPQVQGGPPGDHYVLVSAVLPVQIREQPEHQLGCTPPRSLGRGLVRDNSADTSTEHDAGMIPDLHRAHRPGPAPGPAMEILASVAHPGVLAHALRTVMTATERAAKPTPVWAP
jgi:hypothetical protein